MDHELGDHQIDHHIDDRAIEDHDRGLAYDLVTLVDRRRALALLGGAGLAAALAACGSSGSDAGGTTTTAAAATTTTAASVAPGGGPGAPPDDGDPGQSGSQPTDGTIPEETAGPFPGDGSNGPDALGSDGIVRRDITRSWDPKTGKLGTTAKGVGLRISLTLVKVSEGSKPLANAAVYAWHCDREGRYSMYSDGVTDENYLRGVQVADDNGNVTFTSIFPGAYDGRWPHVHFEVYASIEDAVDARSKLRTSQLALPKATCDEVYATKGYEASVENMERTSLDTDGVFRDGYSLQLGKTAGDVEHGYLVKLTVPV